MDSKFLAIVRCPSCSFKQKTRTANRIVCHSCGHKYKVFPHGKKSRIEKMISGNAHDEYYRLKNGGKIK